MLWTTGDRRRTYVGTFAGVDGQARAPDAARVVVDPRWVGAPARGGRSTLPPEPPRPSGLGAGPVPLQQADAVALLEQQLTTLATRLQGLPAGGSCCGVPAG